MAKYKPVFVCKGCGTVHSQWMGQCPQCQGWNEIVEEKESQPPFVGRSRNKSTKTGIRFHSLKGEKTTPLRHESGMAEFDRICGGGLVEGSVLLVGGDPGIGKSTLLLQILALFSKDETVRCLYISGEESVDQIRLRAERLGLEESRVELCAINDMEVVLDSLAQLEDGRAVAIIDSIQTLYFDAIDSAPGTVSQIRHAAHSLIRLVKRQKMAIVIIGHVTKEGTIAGPRLVEHMVDAVLYFEGERGNNFRILRTVKNRYGPTDEIGLFEMTSRGLAELSNPGALFLESRDHSIPGSVVFAAIEGTRPMLVEIQALVSPSSMAMPRRAVIGWDANRLAMILAVTERWVKGRRFSGCDVYLNVAGGLKISEPAADLAVAAALLSARDGVAWPDGSVFFGEIGLSGQIRPSPGVSTRLKEATKLGFLNAFTAPHPENKKDAQEKIPEKVNVEEVSHIKQLALKIPKGEEAFD